MKINFRSPIFLLLHIFLQLHALKAFNNFHAEANLPLVDYCKYFHYPVEQHTINTKDGYILSYFRLQAQNSTKFKSSLPVILLHHGFIDSSDTWIVNSGPISNSPAFYFADKGYDVWLGNSRGNKYGRSHIKFDPNLDAEFWDFSWQEMAESDLTAGFEYITQYTKQEKINYIGHSQGTLIMFAALSDKNEVIKSKLKKFIAFGPLVSLYHSKSPIFDLIVKENLISFLKAFDLHEIFTNNWATTFITVLACRVANSLCKDGLELASEMRPEFDNLERMDVVMGHYPSGTSLRGLDHFIQMAKHENFQKYDFKNETENMIRYGQIIPPIYNTTNIDIPLYLYVGKYDELADLEDFGLFLKKLNGTKNINITYIEGGHATFLWGKDMSFLVKVLDQIENN